MDLRMDEEKVFKDPVHQYIYVQDRLIWNLIDTKEFQRLRRIRQLGTTYFTFHGAEHSRFSHSLGVYEITRKIISRFERNQYIEWPKEERLISLVAALLHDVGHGPFSHSIEKVLNTNHEEWSKSLILGETEINSFLRQIDSTFPSRVVDVINKKYEKPIVMDLISSQLDADRMDYLLRDAYYTGVNYGFYDLERILRVLRPYQGRLVVKESGMHSVEDYLMSRYQMYWQVYFHPVTRSGEILLRKIFLRAKNLFEEGYTFSTLFPPIVRLFQGQLHVDDYLILDEPMFFTLFYFWSQEKDQILADLTERFLHRRLFQYIDFNPNDQSKLEAILEFFHKNNIDPTYYLELDSPSDLSYDIYRPGDKKEMSPIYLLNRQGETIEISTKSDIIAVITGKRKTEHKIFFPEDLLKEKSILSQFQLLTR
ncbi:MULTISPECIES: HD domain-containing protein [Tepidibacillus]